jgi:hypothetical protein
MMTLARPGALCADDLIGDQHQLPHTRFPKTRQAFYKSTTIGGLVEIAAVEASVSKV